MLKNKILELYNVNHCLNEVAKKTGICSFKVRKILIDMGEYHTPLADKIIKLYKEGKSVEYIAQELGVKYNTVNNYLPYSRCIYGYEQTETPRK